MVVFRTSFRTSCLRFSLAMYYNGFLVDIDSLHVVQVNLQFSPELQCFCGGHGFFISSSYSFACVYPARCIHYAFWIFAESVPFSYMYAKCEVTRRSWDRQIGVKSASSPPRAKTIPRGSKSTIFAKGHFQLFNLQKIGTNPIGDPSVLLIQFPIYLWLQAEVWEAFAIGGWCVVGCIPYFVPLCLNRKFQISKFTVQP